MTCKEVTRLASQSLDKPLPLITRVRIRLHLVICSWCRRYINQVTLIHNHASKYEAQVDETSRKTLSKEAKERMKKAMQDGGG